MTQHVNVATEPTRKPKRPKYPEWGAGVVVDESLSQSSRLMQTSNGRFLLLTDGSFPGADAMHALQVMRSRGCYFSKGKAIEKVVFNEKTAGWSVKRLTLDALADELAASLDYMEMSSAFDANPEGKLSLRGLATEIRKLDASDFLCQLLGFVSVPSRDINGVPARLGYDVQTSMWNVGITDKDLYLELLAAELLTHGEALAAQVKEATDRANDAFVEATRAKHQATEVIEQAQANIARCQHLEKIMLKSDEPMVYRGPPTLTLVH